LIGGGLSGYRRTGYHGGGTAYDDAAYDGYDGYGYGDADYGYDDRDYHDRDYYDREFYERDYPRERLSGRRPSRGPTQRSTRPPAGRKPKRRKAPWYFKLMVVLGSIIAMLASGSLVALYTLAERYENKVDREDIFAGLPQAAPIEENKPLNFLVLGTDARTDANQSGLEADGSRADTIMIAHVNKERTRAFIASIPRDSYVNVPAGGSWKGGDNKINAAFSFGGASLMAKTVYELTDVQLNGAMIVNFNGVHKMVQAVGGVRVCIPYTVKSSFSTKVWGKGCHNMGPAEVEEFMRQRKGTPGGDFGRIKNQQHIIIALAKKITDGGMVTNPSKLDRLLTTAAESLTVDKNMNLRDLAFALKGIDPKNITFATVPYVGTMRTEVGSSVRLDLPGAESLFEAIRADKTDEWLAAHPQPDVASF